MSIAHVSRLRISSIGKDGEVRGRGGLKGGVQQTSQRCDAKKQIIFFVEKVYSLTRKMRLS
jgi:hypothetical protein